MMNMELGRKVMEPAWEWVSWYVVLVLFWLEQVLGVVRWYAGVKEIERIRECWSGEIDRKRR